MKLMVLRYITTLSGLFTIAQRHEEPGEGSQSDHTQYQNLTMMENDSISLY